MKFIEGTFENDFVILKLSSPLQFNINVQPACLPTSKNFLSLDSTEDMCFTSGWGRLQHGKLFLSTSCYLQKFIVYNLTIHKQISLLEIRVGLISPNMSICEGADHYKRKLQE